MESLCCEGTWSLMPAVTTLEECFSMLTKFQFDFHQMLQGKCYTPSSVNKKGEPGEVPGILQTL